MISKIDKKKESKVLEVVRKTAERSYALLTHIIDSPFHLLFLEGVELKVILQL